MGYVHEYVRQFFETYMKLPQFIVTDAIEIIILAFVVYELLVWFKNTRAWGLLKGIIFVIFFVVIAFFFNFSTILWIAGRIFNVAILAIIIIFQPELRRALEQIGTSSKIPFFGKTQTTVQNKITEETVNELVRASVSLGKSKTGALVVLERNIVLEDFIKTGIEIDGVVTAELLINIFEHNTPLHDGAVIIKSNRVTAATCYLPVSENMDLSKELGTRHRAALGISEVSDALTIVVSEETGKISLTRDGVLLHDIDAVVLRNHLMDLAEKKEEEKRFVLWKGRRRHEKDTDK